MNTTLQSRNVLMGIVRIALILFFATHLFSSCTDEQTQNPINHDGETTITFSVKAPGGFSLATYGFTENQEKAITTADVILFKEGKYFSGPHYGTLSGADVSIRIPDGDNTYSMSVFANCRSELNTETAMSVFNSSKTKEEVFAALTFANTSAWDVTPSGNPDIPVKPIPMWGEEDVTILGGTVSGTIDVTLIRMLARINVYNTATNFELTKVYLYNYNTSGRLAPVAGSVLANKVSTPSLPSSVGRGGTALTYPVINDPVDGDKCENEIYTFEAAAGDDDNLSTNTCLVIGGIKDSGNETFYRIEFVEENAGVISYLDLLRNHSYDVEITQVNYDGRDDPEEAFGSKSVNILYNITSWNEAQVGGSTTDGQYKLGVSAATLDFDAEARSYDDVDEINLITVFSDYGATITISEIQSENDWLKIHLNGEANPLINNGSIALSGDNAVKDAKLRLVFDDNSAGNPRSGSFKLKAGRMEYLVYVSQSNVKPAKPLIVVTGLDNYYQLGDANSYEFTIYCSTPFTINTGDLFDLGTFDYDGSMAAPNGRTVRFTPASNDEVPENEVRTAVLTISSTTDPTYSAQLNLTCSNISTSISPEDEANCYIVPPGTDVAIPVSQAYRAASTLTAPSGAVLPSTWFGAGEFAAELVWKDNVDLEFDISMVWEKNSDASILYVKPTVSEIFGNAVIGIRKKNAAGQPEGGFLWSWHIWVTDYNPSPPNTTEKILMDRNLGALNNGFSTDPIDASTIDNISQNAQTAGLLYQWGRKDPFPGSTSITERFEPTLYSSTASYLAGDRCLLKVNTSNIATSSTYKDLSASPQNLCYSIANPHIYYFSSTIPFDWYLSSGVSKNDNLWGNTSKDKTVYDPCPPGWKVPRTGGYTNGQTSPTPLNSAGSVPSLEEAGWYWHETETIRGYRVYQGDLTTYKNQYSFSESAFYPAAGYRSSSGSLTSVGSNGLYWLSSAHSTSGIRLSFAGTAVHPHNSYYRALGHNLRCVQESSE